MAQRKILMIVGDYVEDYEAMVPYQMLLMVGAGDGGGVARPSGLDSRLSRGARLEDRTVT